jgi:hypothetical protein
MFESTKVELEALLFTSSRYKIPTYQRPYTWDRDNAEELLSDLQAYSEDNSTDRLFLGSFILQKDRGERNLFDVVDGQQRLTSVMLLLIACRMRMRELKQFDIAQEIQKAIGYTSTTTGKSTGERLEVSESIRDVFAMMASKEWDGQFPSTRDPNVPKRIKDQRKALEPVYSTFFNALREYSQPKLSSLLEVLYSTWIIRIEVEDLGDALSIFERTNARGAPLAIADLLKNHLFSEKVEGIADRWAQMQRSADDSILRMLKYFYVSQHGYTPKSKLYRNLRDYSRRIGAAKMTNQLFDFSQYYQVTKTKDAKAVRAFAEKAGAVGLSGHEENSMTFARTLQVLRAFKQTQFVPLIYSAFQCMLRTQTPKNTRKGAEAFLRLCRALECLHFVNMTVGRRAANTVEHLIADECEKLSEATDLAAAVERIKTTFRKARIDKDKFIGNFTGLSYSESDYGTLIYIFDRFYNYNWAASEPLSLSEQTIIYDPDAGYDKGIWTVEHFFPQNPPKGAAYEDSLLEASDRIGNLMLLPYRTNGALNNALPSEKIRLLTGKHRSRVQKLTFLHDFVEKYGPSADDWSAAEIQRRGEDLAELAYSHVWAF